MGNCKSCIKSRTSDDLDRPSRQSIREQGLSGAEGSLDVAGPSAERVLSRASGRSRSDSSKSRKSVSRANQPLHSSQIQEVLPPLNIDARDLNRRSSSRAILRSGSAGNRINVRPLESDDYTEDVRNLMNEMKRQYHANNFRDICSILWQEDERLANNRDYKFSRNKGLVVNLNASFYENHPTFTVFRELLRIYTRNENNINHRKSVEDQFLDEVMAKRVMQICWAFLNQARYFDADRNAFKTRLSSIWFPHAFQHIFAGDRSQDQVFGLHNWFQFSLEKDNIEYTGCNKQIPGIMVHIKYRWRGVPKETGSSMFIGTSPEFELALYTLLYFQALRETPREKERTYDLNLGGQHNDPPNVSVRVVIDTKNNHNFLHIENVFLKTAYPIKKLQAN